MSPNESLQLTRLPTRLRLDAERKRPIARASGIVGAVGG